MKARLCLVFAAAAVAACSSQPDATTPGVTGGTSAGGQSTTAGISGTGTAGSSAGSAAGGSATAGSGGEGGNFAQVGGTSGTAGTGGASGGAGGNGGSSLTMGTQADPGTDGDGTFDQPPPYNLAPESQVLAQGAPKGMVSGPFIHTQTGTYTGWSQWKFTYYVYVPAQYKPDHAAALMIFNDGYLYAGINALTDSRFNAPMVFDNLMFEGSMPTTIAVFIFPGTNDGHQVGGGDGGRSTQYDTPNDQYGKFLREEFLPTEILNKYNIVTDPDGWAMAGHSSGGIASIIAGYYHPDRWHKLLTASPSFPNKGGKFPDQFTMDQMPKPLRIYHLSGTMDLNGFKAANDKAAMIFAEQKYHYRYRPGQDQHYPPKAAMADFPDALRWLWRGYKSP
ncbi:MAG TPA: alpha/beta hydrolase-fold protein [Polyangiaceae bacterium]|nr:alpha/beta hydrolase-fold protein [Polyangiaceae bacterium]